MESQKDRLTYVHQIYIRATPQAVWDAITDPQWNGRYGYQAVGEYELKPGGKYRVQANAAIIHTAGGRAIIHSDSPADSQRLNQEAAKAMAEGNRIGVPVTEDDAIKWMTINPAWALGIDDRRVVDIHLVKRIDPLRPRIEVEVEALDDWAFEDERLVL